jgi:enterochelin esterase family protein
MIVVMPAGHVTRNFTVNGVMEHDAVSDNLAEDIIPWIDARYRPLTDRDHRAIAALLMGGWQTLSVSLYAPGSFSMSSSLVRDGSRIYLAAFARPVDAARHNSIHRIIHVKPAFDYLRQFLPA